MHPQHQLRFQAVNLEKAGIAGNAVVNHEEILSAGQTNLRDFSAFSSGTPEGIQVDPLFLWR
jgi:hypothetical protein